MSLFGNLSLNKLTTMRFFGESFFCVVFILIGWLDI